MFLLGSLRVEVFHSTKQRLRAARYITNTQRFSTLISTAQKGRCKWAGNSCRVIKLVFANHTLTAHFGPLVFTEFYWDEFHKIKTLFRGKIFLPPFAQEQHNTHRVHTGMTLPAEFPRNTHLPLQCRALCGGSFYYCEAALYTAKSVQSESIRPRWAWCGGIVFFFSAVACPLLLLLPAAVGGVRCCLPPLADQCVCVCIKSEQSDTRRDDAHERNNTHGDGGTTSRQGR